MPRPGCPRCHSTQDPAPTDAGNSVCSECGLVLDENPIVSEITWTEEPGGASSVVGQFISSTGAKIFRKGGPSGHSKESREVTIENGRKKIAQIAGGLKLKQHHIDAAQRLFMLAVQHNFIQGRKTQNVVAACLYIVCRREKTPHMLIDFSDVLQTNVYVLGHTYLRFCKRLNLQLPVIDPSLYIPRFCGKLEFEEKTQMVANTALRLVQRMRRDWIQTGRRPSGICGAALLISARLHGFKRTQKEILQVVRVCDVTLRKRLQEFALTPSSNLTHEEFEAVEIEEECDPPAFTRARKKDEDRAALAAVQRQEAPAPAAAAPPAEAVEGAVDQTAAALSAQQVRAKGARGRPKRLPAAAEIAPPARTLVVDVEAQDEAEIEKDMIEALGDEEVRRAEADPAPLVQQAQRDTDRDPSDFTDLNDDELNRYLYNEEEVKVKTAIWTENNKEYLAAQLEKEREEAALIAAGKAPPKKKKRRRERQKDAAPIDAGVASASAADAAAEMLKKRAPAAVSVNAQAIAQLFQMPSALRSKGKPAAGAAPVPGAIVSTPIASSIDDLEGTAPHEGSEAVAYSDRGYSDRGLDQNEEDYAPYWEVDNGE